jgi:hypothetical protein
MTRASVSLATIVVLTAAIACSDRSSTGPAATLAKKGVSTDSSTKPDTASQKPDTTSHPDTGVTHPDTGGMKPDTGATNPDSGNTKPDTTSGHGPDTTVTTGPDTTRTDAYLRGTVVGVDSSAGPNVRPKPMANVVVTVFKRVLQNVGSTNSASPYVHGDSVAAVKTLSDGSFDFENLRAGYYILRADPGANSGWPVVDGYPATAWSITSLVLTAPITIYLHKK